MSDQNDNKTVFDRAFDQVTKNMTREINCIPWGFPRFEQYLPGIEHRKYYIVTANSGVGKCFGKGTKILTYDGSVKNVEDIVEGDCLMGPDNTSRIVSGTNKGIQKLYRVSQTGGDDYIVNEDHVLYLLKLTKANYSHYNHALTSQRDRYYSPVTMTIKEYNELSDKTKKFLYGVQCNEIEFPNSQPLNIDPYFAGLWYGDGTKKQMAITNTDKEIIDYIYDFAERNQMQVKKKSITYFLSSKSLLELSEERSSMIVEYKFVPKILGISPSTMRRAIFRKKKIKNYSISRPFKKGHYYISFFNTVSSKKEFIPESIKRSSIKDRQSFLAGILDSDGHKLIKRNCTYELCLKEKQLIEDVSFIARSLGIRVSGYKTRIINGTNYYRIILYGRNMLNIPFLIDRKKCTIEECKHLPRTDIRRINIEELENGEFYGFTVNKDHLFLLNDFTIVHNTQILDHMFLYHPFDYMLAHPEIKIKWFYWSLEMDRETKWIQGTARYLFIKYGIRVDTKTILSVGTKNRISQEIYDKVKEAKEYMDLLESHIIVFHDDPMNPYGIIKEIEKYYKENGIIHTTPFDYIKEDGSKEVRHRFDYYEANDPNEYVISITDHYAELTPEIEKSFGNDKRKLNLKETIEKHADNMRYLRNRYGLTIADCQQQMAAKEEQQFTISGKSIMSKLEPSLDGLGETKLTQRKANVVLGLFAPDRFELPDHAGYDIEKLGDAYRSLKILKNREGISNVRVGLYFDGAVNYFKELPPAVEMNNKRYLNAQLRNIKAA